MTKRELEKRIELWKQFFGLTNWNITIKYEKPKKSSKEDKNFMIYASVDSDHQYKRAILKINPQCIKYFEDSVIVHELIHILISPLIGTVEEYKKTHREIVEYYNEQITTEIERIIIRAVFPKRT